MASTKMVIKLFGIIVFFLVIEAIADKCLIYLVFFRLGREELIGNFITMYWLSVVVGSIPAVIDYRKGKVFFTWWIYWGLISFMTWNVLYAFWEMTKFVMTASC